MMNNTEQEEREYLEVIKEKLLIATRRIDETVRQFSEELRKNKEYIYEHQSGMDEADMVAAGQSINRMAFTGESAVARKKKLIKLTQSPYFGRIDFVSGEPAERTPVYIGMHSFMDSTSGENLIYDWRAPVSSMFYDFELGEAWYKTPSGTITGELVLKRQYRIRDGKMEYMIENALNIQDDVLQRELSKSSDDKMKNIVATIQRDQNAIIRNESSQVMIIQGVAGSGKTSIALHRIAFLLYRFRDTIAAKDILIISPNKVFADYISNVLPELGEEYIPEMGMEELAADLLENKFRFQGFFQQVSSLLTMNDESFIERIRFKSTFEFLSKLNQYIIHIENNFFKPMDIRIAGTVIPDFYIKERFRKYYRIPVLNRIPQVVKDVQNFLRENIKRKLSGREKSAIWEAVPRMFKTADLLELYKDFYNWLKRPELFRMGHGGILENADVYPLIYCKIRLEGVKTYDHIKHLLVDEMQDYTPVQYSVLSRLFNCKKTILGDVSQTVNPYSASSAEDIQQVFPLADTVKLFRSYRSTYEITTFAQRIIHNPNLVAMERHGELPEVKGFNSRDEEIGEVRKRIDRFKVSGFQSMGILCKTQDQSQSLYKILKAPGIHLLTADSTAFTQGVVIAAVHLAKGLEFDEVIIPFASHSNYQNDFDKSLLYIACTRAMHRLLLTFHESKSPFLLD